MGLALITLWILSVIVFAAGQLLPGDPGRAILGPLAEQRAVTTLDHQLGVDKPLITQYWNWLTGILHGDLGTSYTYQQPKSPIDYHGTVEIQPIDKKTSKLLYTLVYDADALPKHEPEDKAKDKAQRTAQFTGLLATMKAAAEAK